MRNYLVVSVLLLTACGSSANAGHPYNALQTGVDPTVQGSNNPPTQQGGQQTTAEILPPAADGNNVAPANTDTNTVVVDGNTPVDTNTKVADSNVPVATVDPNDTNPNHLSVDPVTGLLDYRYGIFDASQGPPDARSNDGCGMLTAGGILYLNAGIVTFGYDPVRSPGGHQLVSGATAWISGAGNAAVPATYHGTGLICSYMFYPDATGTYTCYRPATTTQTACSTTVVMMVRPRNP